MSMEPPRSKPDSLVAQVLLLALLLFVVHTWLQTHLELDVAKIAIVDGFLAVFALSKGFFEKDENEQLGATLRRSFRVLLRPGVLITLFVMFLILASVFSSVTILGAGKSTVRLAPEESSKPAVRKPVTADEMVRFVRATTPFGRPFSLEVNGYQPYSFDLYPWVPKRIRVKEDLNVAPSILVRVPVPVQMQLSQGVIRVRNGSKLVAEVRTTPSSAGVIVGTQGQVPESLVPRWERQLRSDQVDLASQERAIELWLSSQRHVPQVPLAPGMELEATFHTPGGVTARRSFVVGSEALQDVILQPVRGQT